MTSDDLLIISWRQEGVQKISLKMDIQLNVLYAQNFYHWQIKQKSQFL